MMRIEQVEDLLDEFDFDKVKKVMDFLEWNYFDSPDKEVSIGELRRMARRLLEYGFNADPSPEYYTASGGFEVTRYMYPGDTTKYLTLKFVVTEWSKPVC
jgi:hypothetical protein